MEWSESESRRWRIEKIKNELHLDMMSDILTSGFIITSVYPEYEFIYANDLFAQMTEYENSSELEKCCVRSPLEFVCEPDRKLIYDAGKKNQDAGIETAELRYRMKKKNGGFLWVQQKSRYLHLKNGETVIFSSCFDITVQKQEEEEFLNVISYRTGLAMTSIGCLRLDITSGEIIEKNANFPELEPLFDQISTVDQCFEMALDRMSAESASKNKEILNRKNLINDFQRGHVKDTLEYCDVDIQIWTQLDYLMMRNPMTGHVESFCIVKDVTDQHADEHQGHPSPDNVSVIQQKDAFELALSRIGLRYWEYDIKSKRLYRSKLVQDEVGYDAYKENVPESYIDEKIIHPDYAQAYLDFYHNLQKGIDDRLVFQSKFSDGSWGWLDISYKVLFDRTGKPYKAIGVGGNITEQKKSEYEASLLNRDVNAYIAAIKFMYKLCLSANYTKNTYRLIEENDFFTEAPPASGNFDELILTISKAHVHKDDWNDFYNTFSRETRLKEYFAGRQSTSLIYRQLEADGLWHWHRTIAMFAENNVDDDIIEFSFTECIDTLKESELALKEREKQLMEALQAVRKADNAKSDFLSRMSHDLRTPLNSIINLAGLAADGDRNHEEIAADLNKIGVAGEFMLGLINDILDMSTIENHKMTLRPSVCTHEEFVNYLEGVVLPLCASKNIQFIWDKHKAPPIPLWIDKIRFNQIFFNILSNSVKYTDAGGIVEFHENNVTVTDTHLSCDYIITDNGRGMSKEFQAKMFEPFERADSAEAFVGTGLGLSITKNLIELMNGTISVESTLGQGTTTSIHLELPIATEEQRQAAAKNSAGIEKYYSDGSRVLVVEDHPLNREIVVRLLEKGGCKTECVCNGLEAVDKIRQSTPGYFQLILMDIRMPVMDGITATKTIRSLPREDAKNIPIIAMTANAFDTDRERSLEAGMNEHLSKPIVPGQLFETMAKYIVPNKF